MDFNLKSYRSLLEKFMDHSYGFKTFSGFLKKTGDRVLFLRHDVDKFPLNSLRMAELESEMRIQASYYFRSINESFHPEIMKKISALGHEVGYHCGSLVEITGSKDFQKPEIRNTKFEVYPNVQNLNLVIIYKASMCLENIFLL